MRPVESKLMSRDIIYQSLYPHSYSILDVSLPAVDFLAQFE
jgi:hypothetical protein